MKLFNLFHKKEDTLKETEVEYYYRTNYGGTIFTLRSNVDFYSDRYRILDAAYDELRLSADTGRVAEKVLKALSWKSKINSAKVEIDGKECEIRFHSNPYEFIDG